MLLSLALLSPEEGLEKTALALPGEIAVVIFGGVLPAWAGKLSGAELHGFITPKSHGLGLRRPRRSFHGSPRIGLAQPSRRLVANAVSHVVVALPHVRQPPSHVGRAAGLVFIFVWRPAFSGRLRWNFKEKRFFMAGVSRRDLLSSGPAFSVS